MRAARYPRRAARRAPPRAAAHRRSPPARRPCSLLDNPNLGDPAQREAFIMCRDNRDAYIERVKQLAKIYDPKAGAPPAAAK